MKSLVLKALIKFISGVLICTLLIFWPAGTLSFFKGWLFIGVLFGPMLIGGIILIFKNPRLLEKRLNSREEQGEQQRVMKLSGLLFIFGFLAAGFDYRYGWLPLPEGISIAAALVLLVSYGLYFEVMRENTYLSRTVEVQENQKLVDTGLYGIVRHPMYFVSVVMFLAIPLVLGSLISLAFFLLYPALIVKRIKNEEQVLEQGLPGYAEYKKKVKYRLIPFIW